MEKKLIATLCLRDAKVVSAEDETKIIAEDAVQEAVHRADLGADELIVRILDDAGNGQVPEDAYHTLRMICSASDIPVAGETKVLRMEDVKKILYTGCKKAVLQLEEQEQTMAERMALFHEVSSKFGKDRMIIRYTRPESVEKQSAVLADTAGALLLAGAKTLQDVRARIVKGLPLAVALPECTFEDAVELLGEKNIIGVCGPYVDNHADAITLRKQMLSEIGMETLVLKPQHSFRDFKTNERGLLPVVVQDYRTDEVLMVAYMNEEAYTQTIRTGRMTYYSREREKLWVKGEESGHFQYVKQLTADCDLDTLLARVKQIGAACHTGNRSCFFNEVAKRPFQEKNPLKVLESVYAVIEDRKANPREGSYTNYLFDKGIDKILKKLGEEATEITIAAKNPDVNELHYEIADYLYHLMVLMSCRQVTWEEITETLSRR